MKNVKKTWESLPAVTKVKFNMIAKCLPILPSLRQKEQNHDVKDENPDFFIVSNAFYEKSIFGDKVSREEVELFVKAIFRLNDICEDSPDEQKKSVFENLKEALTHVDYGFEDNEQYWQDRDIYELENYVGLAEKLGLKTAGAVRTFLQDTDAKESFVKAFSEAVEKANHKDRVEDDYDYS